MIAINNKQTAAMVLADLVTSLEEQDKMFHLDDDPADHNCFTAEEAKEIDAKIEAVREHLNESQFWEVVNEALGIEDEDEE